jgi:DNA-directed RNA polymerase subunit RPC12/RpoP
MDQAGESGQSFPCSNCGAKLQYDAGTQAMRCPYCNFQQAIPQQPSAGPREIPIEEGMRLAARGFGTPVTQIGCRECGAVVNVIPGEQTATCTFCRSQQVLAQESAGTAIRPESVVPFKVDKNAAAQRFEDWLGSLWFRPNDLKQMAKLHDIAGVYVPFWTFDARVDSSWTAEAGYHYYVTEQYTDQQGNKQTRQVQHTRWEHARGRRADHFDDVVVCASKGLPPDLVQSLPAFDTRQLTPYRPEFLAGWRAESYAIDLMPAWQQGQETMASTQQSRCASDIPGDTHRNLHVNNQFSYVTFKHVLLPVWIAAYRYRDEPYRFLVNGQTGEVVGKAPYSFWKIFFFVLFLLAIVGTIVVLAQRGQAGSGRSSGAGAPTSLPPAPAQGSRSPSRTGR